MKLSTTFRPMLAGEVKDLTALNYPVMGSPKLDGIRCVILQGKAVTRNLKFVPNNFIFEKLRGLPAFDGELIVGADTGIDIMQRSQSGIMSADGEPDFKFRVFDMLPSTINRLEPFEDRHRRAARLITSEPAYRKLGWLQLVKHTMLNRRKEVEIFERVCVDKGYEGIMLRDPQGVYKYGRSTWNEAGLLKMKRFLDAEACITGVKELMHNANEAKKNVLGLTERSSHKGNKLGKGTLGALIVKARLPKPGKKASLGGLMDLLTANGEVQFDIGTGFTEEQRSQIWACKNIIGKIVKFKYQSLTPDGVPRFPVFLGFRED